MTTQTVFVEVVKGTDGKYRVRQSFTNGRIFSSSPDYASRWNARRAARRLAKLTGFEVRETT